MPRISKVSVVRDFRRFAIGRTQLRVAVLSRERGLGCGDFGNGAFGRGTSPPNSSPRLGDHHVRGVENVGVRDVSRGKCNARGYCQSAAHHAGAHRSLGHTPERWGKGAVERMGRPVGRVQAWSRDNGWVLCDCGLVARQEAGATPETAHEAWASVAHSPGKGRLGWFLDRCRRASAVTWVFAPPAGPSIGDDAHLCETASRSSSPAPITHPSSIHAEKFRSSAKSHSAAPSPAHA